VPQELVASAAQTFGLGAAIALIPASLEEAAHRLTFVMRRSYPQYCP
jgi:hypothetical protein